MREGHTPCRETLFEICFHNACGIQGMHAEYLKVTTGVRSLDRCRVAVETLPEHRASLGSCIWIDQKLQASASEERERVVSQDARPRATNVLTRRDWYLFKCQFGMTCEGAKYYVGPAGTKMCPFVAVNILTAKLPPEHTVAVLNLHCLPCTQTDCLLLLLLNASLHYVFR